MPEPLETARPVGQRGRVRELALRLEQPTPGGVALVVVAVANVLVWALARPAGQPTARYAGEVCGAEAVLLFACTLVLAMLLPAVERAFGGLDRVVVWHRRTATAATLLLIPHVALASSTPDPYAHGVGPALGDVALLGLLLLTLWALAPGLRAARYPGLVRRLARATYERWLTAHRLAGWFVIVAVAHGALVDPVLRESTLLRVVFYVVGGTGIVAYLYRELFARFVVPIHEYTVAEVRRPNASLLEVSLEPTGQPLSFVPGQFVVVAFGGPSGWQRHPFSVASGPSSPRLELGIKAAGDYTGSLRDSLAAGTPAKVVGPFGGFDYHSGGREQIWIAGGIGVTPFVSWIRSLDATFDRHVDFWYSLAHDGDAVYLEEIRQAAIEHPTFIPHLVVADRDGFLTAETAAAGRASLDGVWVYLCGPQAMTDSLVAGFRERGVPGSRLRWEQFAPR
jgi:predicted ferric reductase